MRGPAAFEPRSATLLERTLAYLVDSLLTAALWAAVVLPFTGLDADAFTSGTSAVIAWTLFLLVPFTYFTLSEGAWGTTLGKRALRLRVVDEHGQRPGLFAATVRNVLRLTWALTFVGPAFLLLDAYLVQHTEADQRVGDQAAGTRVLRTSR